jgi:S-adenosyl-L-methionine hydrolase (adenosine-forming)
MSAPRPVCLFSDFGWEGPYVGLMHAAALCVDPSLLLIDVQHDAPRWQPGAAGVLLQALLPWLPERALVVAVIDPGVGGARDGLALEVGGRTLLGPDNGLFETMLPEAETLQRLDWQPERTPCASFHGRDWFVPAAAHLATGASLPMSALRAGDCVRPGFDRHCVIYRDAFGNLMTGIRAKEVAAGRRLTVGGQILPRVRTFCEVPVGQPLCYANSLGLLEIAVNQGNAARHFGLAVGDGVTLK